MTRTALVTGAAGGIGTALVSEFLRDSIEVIALVRAGSAERANASFGLSRSVRIVECDLSDARDRTRVFTEIGPVDILVNNAAIYPRTDLENLNMDELRAVFEVNTVAALELMQRVSQHMRKQHWGRVINITSITTMGGFSQLAAYAGSKGAVTAASRIAAREWGPDSVTVNCVAPGAIPTAAEPEGSDEAVIARQCLPFRGSVNDIADAVCFLASERARFITGQTLVVDGGWTMS